MSDFSSRTGLIPSTSPPRRYLWTDAFAVCNYLELFRQSGDDQFTSVACQLVSQVHHILGKHREDDVRQGWISGLSEEEGKRHPTLGGLRIGKALPERRPDESYDDYLEWERDGQYYHYLTKWMHALDCLARVTGEPVYLQWAVELAQTAHARFTYTSRDGRQKRMYWKMSIDLSHPQVASMGQHDPLDGLVTYQQLQSMAGRFSPSPVRSPQQFVLQTEISDMIDMCEGMTWVTEDSLGIGGLLSDACRLAQLQGHIRIEGSAKLLVLLKAAKAGLEAFSESRTLTASVDYRLAFRELGLSIGLHALNLIRSICKQHPEHFPNQRELGRILSQLNKFNPLIDRIESFWLEAIHQQSPSWKAHQDINSVMLATSLAPQGYLNLQ